MIRVRLWNDGMGMETLKGVILRSFKKSKKGCRSESESKYQGGFKFWANITFRDVSKLSVK